MHLACNHPSLVSKDFSADRDAVEPRAVKESQDLDDADDLADLFGAMGMSASRKCQLCQTACVSLSTVGCEETKVCEQSEQE